MNLSTRKIGVLVMSYGTPQSLDQIADYYTHIRRGSPPSQDQLDDLKRRYEAVAGGFFPLRENTNKQVQALEQTLNRTYGSVSARSEFICYQGLKHAFPFIEDGVKEMAADGIQEAVGVVLAPHYSMMSVGGYIKRAQAAAEEAGIAISFVQSYHLHPKLIETLSARVSQALLKFNDAAKSERTDSADVDSVNSVKVIFTAHSLPASIIEMKDPYPQQLLESSQAVADRCGIANWSFAWQSAGRTAAPWLGPDIVDVIRKLHCDAETNQLLICPIGFVSDHLEVLYDIDIECQAVAAELGLHLERTESLNTDPLYMEALSEVIFSKLN